MLEDIYRNSTTCFKKYHLSLLQNLEQIYTHIWYYWHTSIASPECSNANDRIRTLQDTIASNVEKTATAKKAIDLLNTCFTGMYTHPSKSNLYPAQWNWDTWFISMARSTFDPWSAFRELESFFQGQWVDGMVPSILFRGDDSSYFPNSSDWNCGNKIPSSGITQPPVAALALRHILIRHDAIDDIADRIIHVLEHIDRWHNWFAKFRTPYDDGRVAIVHNWESGMDNSPAWDEPLMRVPAQSDVRHRRRDLELSIAEHRPSDEDYSRYFELLSRLKNVDYDARLQLSASPFVVLDVCINSILLRSEEELIELANQFGLEEIASNATKRRNLLANSMSSFWHEDLAHFCSIDVVSGDHIPIPTSAGFLPLLAGSASSQQAQQLADKVNERRAAGIHLIPSYGPDQPGFDGARYWRGPIWPIVNWMIADGMKKYGHLDVSAAIVKDTITLIEEHGFAEYFDPLTGAAAGEKNQAWSAAVYLLMVAPDEQFIAPS